MENLLRVKGLSRKSLKIKPEGRAWGQNVNEIVTIKSSCFYVMWNLVFVMDLDVMFDTYESSTRNTVFFHIVYAC